MSTVLKDIQDTVIKYANIISQVIQVDVEIVDSNLFRIAGTGKYANKINQDISSEGYVYSTVLKTGQSQVIKNPGSHKICISCSKQLVCNEKFEMCTPIKLYDEILGVIGLICFTEEQRQHMLENYKIYHAFLEQIAEFISVKAYEKTENDRKKAVINLLTHVLNKIDKGVLVLSNDNRITHINKTASEQLHLNEESLSRKVNLQCTGDSLLDYDEFKLEIDGNEYQLIGEAFPVEIKEENYSQILIFNEIKTIKNEVYQLTSMNSGNVDIDSIIGKTEAIENLKENIKKVANSSSTVLITGESGTGKELVARAIFSLSDRYDKPFVAINCGAIPDTLLESELFGYVKGAFTGADPRGKIGKFELANNGIIFLDEIGDMPLYLQVKLLRVLQERKVTRIGSNQMIDINVRIIAATNKDLKEAIHENKFREDLYYRLNVIPLEVPPLRERKDDIERLLQHFIGKYTAIFGKTCNKIDKEVLITLKSYFWPGNIRELENAVEFMINMMSDDGIINIDTLPKNLLSEPELPCKVKKTEIRSLRDVEKSEIQKSLEFFGTTTEGKQMAAKKLGIGIATLYRKIDFYNLAK